MFQAQGIDSEEAIRPEYASCILEIARESRMVKIQQRREK